MSIQYTQIRAILDSVAVPTIIFCHNQVRVANHAAIQWSETRESDTTQKSLWDWIHPQSRRIVLSTYRHLLKGQHPQTAIKVCIQHPTRNILWVSASINPATYLDNNCWIVTFSELNIPDVSVSDETPTDSRKQQSYDRIVDNPTLNEIIAEHRLRDNILEQFLETLQEIVPCSSSSIALIRDNMLEFIAARGMLEGIDLSLLNHELNIIERKPLMVMLEDEHGRVQKLDDVLQEPNWIPIEGTEYIRSWMGILLYYDNNMIGLLNLEYSEPNYFTPEHARLALSLARQASLAIVYTRLYQQAQLDIHERERLQQILVQNLVNTETMYAAQQILSSHPQLKDSLPELLEILASSIDDAHLFLVVFDEEEETLLHLLKSPDANEDTWMIFKNIINQPQLPEYIMPVDDFSKTNPFLQKLDDGRQVLAVVINKRGMLFALRPKDTHTFSEIDKELIATVANQITVAVENKRLDAQVKQHTQQLERLVEQRTLQLSVEQKRLQAILDATAEGIFYMENFLIQYANPAFCRMVGYSFDELYGKPLSFVRMISDDDEPHNFSILLDNPFELETGRTETRLRHRNGTEFYANIRYSIIGQPNDNPIRMVAVARDISQERKLYIQRARFIANAAHELRTPLSSLVLRLHLLRRQPEKVDAHLNNLDQVADYLRQLVEQLLDISRFERGTISLERGDFILQELIQQAVTEHMPFAREENVTLELNLIDTPLKINGDGTRLIQMFSNLVANGINYNHPDGKVVVRLSLEEDVVGNRNAIIEVNDNGMGIDPELLPDEIFEPFSRPSAGSRRETGMGLALVREIAVLHEGAVHVRSQLNEGSNFRVSLPLN